MMSKSNTSGPASCLGSLPGACLPLTSTMHVPILGIMVTRGGRWVIHSWLSRHAEMFETLAILDGSPPGSIDATWTLQQCSLYGNVLCQLESQANLSTPVTDQTARAAAMKLLLRPGDNRTLDEQLDGRWILNAHPDEFYTQDVRALAGHVALRDPRASCVLFGAAYVMPTRAEFEAIGSGYGASVDGHRHFSPLEHLLHVDASYPFREPRLWRYVAGTRWGTRHGVTTPETHPNHRVWPTVRELKLGAAPFMVHFKIHDFAIDAFTLAEGCGSGVLCDAGASIGSVQRRQRRRRQQQWWVAFNRSGFATGLAPHRTHGRLHVDQHRSPRETVLSYYELAGRSPVSLKEEIRRRCSGLAPRCTVSWTTKARFRGLR
jgi:hypothetical protein